MLKGVKKKSTVGVKDLFAMHQKKLTHLHARKLLITSVIALSCCHVANMMTRQRLERSFYEPSSEPYWFRKMDWL